MFKKRGLGLECWLMNLLTCAWYVSGVLPGVLIDESPDVRLMCWLMCAWWISWRAPVLLSGVCLELLIDVYLTCWLMCVCFVCLECCLMNLLTCACFVDWWISWRVPVLLIDESPDVRLMCAWRVDWCVPDESPDESPDVRLMCAWRVDWCVPDESPDVRLTLPNTKIG